MHTREFDLVVIGGGSGGYAAARTAHSKGLKTAVIEGGQELGGLCILRGCMPTKALLYAAEIRHLASTASTWGIQIPHVTHDWGAVMARKDAMIREFAGFRAGQLQDGRFTLIRAKAHFRDPYHLELDSGEIIKASHFVISTGSVTSRPPVPGLTEAGYITSDEAVNLKSLPKSMTVLGGGAVALEFAQCFSRFGVKITLIQRSPQILRDFDPDAAEAVVKVIRREGIEVHTGTQLLKAQRTQNGVSVLFEKDGTKLEVESEQVLNALGREPNTASLALEKAGVATENGRIITSNQMQTSARHIYAAGDCCGPYEIVHIAIQQGEIAAHNIINPDAKRSMNYRLITSVVFTDPQVATVGLTEKTAKQNDTDYITASYPFNDHGKSMIMNAMDGFVKLLADPRTGEILGGAVVGPIGGDLIHEISAAMYKHMTVSELAAMPHYHPTLAEIWTYPAEELAEQIG